MAKNKNIEVNGSQISVLTKDEVDYISLTDMTGGFKEGSGLIGKWITNKNTIEYLGIWEKINNPAFNYPEFGVIENESGVNRFILSAGRRMDRTNTTTLPKNRLQPYIQKHQETPINAPKQRHT